MQPAAFGPDDYSETYPRQYVAYKVTDGSLTASTLDGDISKPVWEDVAWTDDFVGGFIGWVRGVARLLWMLRSWG